MTGYKSTTPPQQEFEKDLQQLSISFFEKLQEIEEKYNIGNIYVTSDYTNGFSFLIGVEHNSSKRYFLQIRNLGEGYVV